MHFLVEYVERDHPELLSFADELFHLDSAARVSVESIQKVGCCLLLWFFF